jgi:hypothetical protein
MQYKDVTALLAIELTQEDSPETHQLIRDLRLVRQRGHLTKREFLEICRWKSPARITDRALRGRGSDGIGNSHLDQPTPLRRDRHSGLAIALRSRIGPHEAQPDVAEHFPDSRAVNEALRALVIAVLFYRPPENKGARPRSVADSLHGLATVLRNGRFLALILITAGFWLIQGQMYASMPKYVLRMVGDAAMPEWYANVNPLVVVLCVVPVTHLVRKLAPIGSIAIALGLIPISAAIMGFSTRIGSMAAVAGIATHPVTIAMVLGISLQGFAECFLSPRYLEFASKQALPGQEGLYMGYAHINTFFAWFVGFVLSGYLLDAFCPDPARLPAADQAARLAALAGHGPIPAAYAEAHVIWWVFAGVGVVAFAANDPEEVGADRYPSSALTASRFDTVSRPSRPAPRQVPHRHAATVRRAIQCARHTGHVWT